MTRINDGLCIAFTITKTLFGISTIAWFANVMFQIAVFDLTQADQTIIAFVLLGTYIVLDQGIGTLFDMQGKIKWLYQETTYMVYGGFALITVILVGGLTFVAIMQFFSTR